MRLLLISNSTNPGEGYLEHPKETIREFLTALLYPALRLHSVHISQH